MILRGRGKNWVSRGRGKKKLVGKEGEVTHIGITHTTVKIKEEVFLVPNTELHEHKIQIIKKANKE